MNAIAILGILANGFQIVDGVGKTGKLAKSLWKLIRDRLSKKSKLALPEDPKASMAVLQPMIEPVLEAELVEDSAFAEEVRSQAQGVKMAIQQSGGVQQTQNISGKNAKGVQIAGDVNELNL